MSQPVSRKTFRLWALYGCTVFLSSFLLFLIQPILTKQILPWFGGSAAVWITCLVFFQVALLLGYLYAHVCARLRVHIALLGAAVLLLPVIPAPHWIPAAHENPAWRILVLLTAVLGLPYFLLCSTGPLLQSWYARQGPEAQPYRLFALSNAGALLALVAYPVLIEPRISTRMQAILWSFGFAGFAALWTFTAAVSPGTELRRRLHHKPQGSWIALSAAGSMLLLATTNQLTQNVAAAPFLWILPLAIYLLTFILCFESSGWYRPGLSARLLAVALGWVGYAIYDIQATDAIVVALPTLTLGLFVMCMYCHGELSSRKPEGAQLTSFYVMVAAGGALGAVCVGLIAPVVFSGIYELPVTLCFVAGLAAWLNWSHGWSQRLLWIVVTVAMSIVLLAAVRAYHQNTLVMMRNFYGAMRVVQSSHSGAAVRTLYHGTIKHGAEFLPPPIRMWPASYYGPPSGIGLALQNSPSPKRVGVIGLGVGTLSAYGHPGDTFHFYEINPQVVAIAYSQFFYLRETSAQVYVTAGDARLSLERTSPQSFDVLAVDAFSGDAIPVHLLTREAFALYFRHLQPTGILAIHISNQYLDLGPVVWQLAAFYGRPAVLIHSPKDENQLLSAATWVLVTNNVEFLASPAITGATQPIQPRTGLRLWTDDYNNLLQVIRWMPAQ